jgi:predicted small lipoprotein YifL
MTVFHAELFKSARCLGMVAVMQPARLASALALTGLLIAALSLAGCGRKSGLDLPPSAAAAPTPTTAAQSETKSVMSPISKPAKPQPRVVPNRSLPIDILVD